MMNVVLLQSAVRHLAGAATPITFDAVTARSGKLHAISLFGLQVRKGEGPEAA